MALADLGTAPRGTSAASLSPDDVRANGGVVEWRANPGSPGGHTPWDHGYIEVVASGDLRTHRGR
jgi:hypothetical protein